MLFPVPAARSVIAHRVEWQGSAVAVDGLSLRQGETVVVTPPHGGAAFQARIQAVLCSSVWLLTAEDRCLHLDFSDIEAGVFQLSAWTKQWQGTSPLSAPQELPLQQLATQPSRTLRLEARHHSATGLPTIELVGEEGLLPERRPGLPLEAELPFVDALVQRGALAAGFREASLVLEQQEQAHGSGAASLRPTVRRLCQMAALSLAEWRGLVQRLASLVVSTPLAEAILRHRWLRELYWATLGVDASAIVPPLGPLGLGSVIDGVVHSRTATVAAAEVLALAEVVAGARRLRAMVAPSGGPDAAAAPGDSAHLWQLLDAVFLEPGLLLLNGEPMQSGSRHGDGVAVAVSARPLEERQRRDYYFEVKLEADLPARFPAAAVFRTELAVGFAHSHDLVGLKAHADAIYFDVAHSTLHSGSNVLHLPTLLDGVQAGDVIGCGLKDDMAYFTCNGVVLGAFHSLDTRRPMHVALSANAVVRVRVVLREEADRAGGFCFEAEEREVVSVDYLLDSGVHCVPAGLEQAAGEAAPCELPLRQSVQAEAIRSLALMLASLCEACETRWLEAKLPASARDDLTTALAALLANESVTDVEKNAVLYSSVARLLRRLVLESRVVDVSRILSPWRRVAAMVQSYLALLRQLTSTPSSSSSSSSSSSAAIAPPSPCLQALLHLLGEYEARHAMPLAAVEVAEAAPEAAASAARTDPYLAALGDHRVRILSFAETGLLAEHAFAAQASGTRPTGRAVKRILSELHDMVHMECAADNAIFVVACEEQCNVMRALITGAAGTPFGYGCFLFDVLCPASYPAAPPQLFFCTTGRGAVRLTPNLYNNGKVCLSLLGTWRGQSSEAWTGESTLYQVFQSIQALVLVEDVYFTEPGFEEEQGSVRGGRLNQAYANIARFATVKYAIVDALRDPPPPFAEVIR
jgi:ubiquitin-protein ligase